MTLFMYVFIYLAKLSSHSCNQHPGTLSVEFTEVHSAVTYLEESCCIILT